MHSKTQELKIGRDGMVYNNWNIDRFKHVANNWSETLERGYTLYFVCPGVYGMDTVFALTETNKTVNKKTGDLEETEIFVRTGTLSLETPETEPLDELFTDTSPEHFHRISVMGPRPDKHIKDFANTKLKGILNPRKDTISVDTQEIYTKYSEDYITLDGVGITVELDIDEFLVEIAEHCDMDDVENNHGAFEETLEALCNGGNTAFEKVDGKPRFRYSTRLKFNNLAEGRNIAVEYYLESVLDTPGLSHVYGYNEYLQKQKDVADRLGISASAVSHQLSKANEQIERAHWTVNNITTD